MMKVTTLTLSALALVLLPCHALVFVKTPNGMEQRDFAPVSMNAASSSSVGTRTATQGVGIAVPQANPNQNYNQNYNQNNNYMTRSPGPGLAPRLPHVHYRENQMQPRQPGYFNPPDQYQPNSRNRYMDGSSVSNGYSTYGRYNNGYGYNNNNNYWPPPETVVQGGSRRTYTSSDPYNNNYSNEISMYSAGRGPMQGKVEYWENPSSASARVRTYSMHGTPIQTSMGFRNGRGTTSVRNTGPMAFPMGVSHRRTHNNQLSSSSYDPYAAGRSYEAAPTPYRTGYGGGEFARSMSGGATTTIQGGNSLRTFPLGPSVDRVQVVLSSESWMPVQAVIELWQGPSNVQQLAEVYTEDGRPFSSVFETQGYYGGSTIAIRNTGPTTFPIQATVRKYV